MDTYYDPKALFGLNPYKKALFRKIRWKTFDNIHIKWSIKLNKKNLQESIYRETAQIQHIVEW